MTGVESGQISWPHDHGEQESYWQVVRVVGVGGRPAGLRTWRRWRVPAAEEEREEGDGVAVPETMVHALPSEGINV